MYVTSTAWEARDIVVNEDFSRNVEVEEVGINLALSECMYWKYVILKKWRKNCFSWTNHNYFTHQCLHLDKYTHKYEWRLWTSQLVLLHTWQSLNLSMKLLLLQYRPSEVNSLCCPVELPPSNHGGGGGALSSLFHHTF